MGFSIFADSEQASIYTAMGREKKSICDKMKPILRICKKSKKIAISTYQRSLGLSTRQKCYYLRLLVKLGILTQVENYAFYSESRKGRAHPRLFKVNKKRLNQLLSEIETGKAKPLIKYQNDSSKRFLEFLADTLQKANLNNELMDTAILQFMKPAYRKDFLESLQKAGTMQLIGYDNPTG